MAFNADCDPAGYQMAVSIGHKLRALKEVMDCILAVQEPASLHLIAKPLADFVIGRRVQAEGINLRRQDGEIAEIDAAFLFSGT